MKSLADVFDKIFNDPKLKKHYLEGAVMAAWPQVVGRQIAQISKAQAVKDGTLYVRVTSASWRNELSFMREDIVERLNKKVGKKAVKKIVLR